MKPNKIKDAEFAEKLERAAYAYSEGIVEAVESDVGLDHFFTGYLQSKLFIEESPENKAKAFGIYRSISDYLDSVHGDLYAHGLVNVS